MQMQNAVTAGFSSKQLLIFVFVEQYGVLLEQLTWPSKVVKKITIIMEN